MSEPFVSMLPVLVVFVGSFLLGSVVAGILFSRAMGADIRQKDLPGGSGTYRQYGLAAALGVTLFDILKGVAAVSLALWLAPQFTWLAVFGVVLGHCYPIFFAWRGGGGIAPFLGALLLAAPLTLLGLLLISALIMPIYKVTLQKKLKLNVIPFTAALALPLGTFVAWRYGGLADLWAGGAAMLLRAVQMLRQDLGQEK